LSEEEEAERRPIRVVVDTSYDDSEIVEQHKIQDHVPLKHRTPRKSATGSKSQGRRSTATCRGTVVSKRHHPLSSSLLMTVKYHF
jgi:BRCT domain type II-containing protein